MTTAYLNRIAGAVQPHDVHATVLHFAESLLLDDPCRMALFRRMVRRAGIEHRYSLLSPADDPEGTALDIAGLYVRGKFRPRQSACGSLSFRVQRVESPAQF